MSGDAELFIIEAGKEVQTLSDVNWIIDNIKLKVQPLVADINTKNGRREIVSNAFKVTKTKTALISAIDNVIAMREKEIKPFLDEIEKFKKNKKFVNAELTQLAQDVRNSVTQWEENEALRIQQNKEKIDLIVALGNTKGSTLELNQAFLKIGEIIVDSAMREFEEEAKLAKTTAYETLKANMVIEQKREEEAEELVRLRKEVAEREKKEQEEALKREIENKVKEEVDAKLIEAEKNTAELMKKAAEAEEARIRAEEKAKAEVELAAQKARDEEIRKQLAAEIKKKAEQEAREKNKQHVNNIRAKAKLDLMKIVDEDCARKIVLAIDADEISNVKINY
jgi:colicin import membrane protein